MVKLVLITDIFLNIEKIKNINKIDKILKETDLEKNEDIIHTRFQIIIKTGPPKYKSELIMYPSRPINYPLWHSIST